MHDASPWAVPLANFAVTEDDLAAVTEVYRSGWLTQGPCTECFEGAFAEFTGARHAVAVSSGTAALHLMCLAAGLKPGDEVIVPSLTFVATANAVAYTGATPVFADIANTADPWISAAQCASLVTPRTRGVLYVAYGGHAGDIDAIRSFCDDAELFLLEDAAHAAGSRLEGQHLGTYGLAGAFSLYSNKNLAVGEGGVVVTADDAFAARLRRLRSHGMTSQTWDRHRGLSLGYDVSELGFSYRLDEPRAALATSRLRRLDEDNSRRAKLDAAYRAALADLDLTMTLRGTPGLASSHHLFTVVLPADVDRDRFRRQLADAGIQTSVHYPAVHRMQIYRSDAGELPLTEQYAAKSVTLPLFAEMTDGQQDSVIAAIARALDVARRRVNPLTAPG